MTKYMCCVIGDPVEQSLSPQVHNAGYKALGIDDTFAFIPPFLIKEEGLEDFLRMLPSTDIRGVSVTIPHKITALQFLKSTGAYIGETADAIGAVNTIVNKNGRIHAYNTDWLGAARAVEQAMPIKGKHVAVLGAGGAARALAYAAMRHKAASVSTYNRTPNRAMKLADDFGGNGFSLDDIASIEEADIIMNGTDVGMGDKADETLVPKQYLHKGQVVFDAVFKPHETRLLREAKEQGTEVVYGKEMLLQLVLEQFNLYTGEDAPESVMRDAIGLPRRTF